MNIDLARLLDPGTSRDAPSTPIRPPGSFSEARFTHACDGCQQCVESCPELILVKGADGRPEVDFRKGYCTFCLDCIHACPVNALVHERAQPLWTLAICIDDDVCLSEQGGDCRRCGDACHAGAVRFVAKPLGGLSVEVEPAACTGCGGCVAPCPVDAIFLENLPSPSAIIN